MHAAVKKMLEQIECTIKHKNITVMVQLYKSLVRPHLGVMYASLESQRYLQVASVKSQVRLKSSKASLKSRRVESQVPLPKSQVKSQVAGPSS